jgi:hypothetical protein
VVAGLKAEEGGVVREDKLLVEEVLVDVLVLRVMILQM